MRAVADSNTPVSVYSSAPDFAGQGGWGNEGGTSAAAPLVAGIDAHASEYIRSLSARAFYESPTSLFDVTTGSNGT